jgi:hypothetical protein
MAGWSTSTSSTHNWDILKSVVSSVDSLSVNFTVVADDEHAVIAIDDVSGWQSNDSVFREP